MTSDNPDEMLSAWTPGPWLIVTTPNASIPGANWREIKVSEHGQVLAEVFHDMGDPDPALLDDEAAANARLIAAAPCLAEALIELDRELLFDKPVSGTAAKAFAKARAALSRLNP